MARKPGILGMEVPQLKYNPMVTRISIIQRAMQSHDIGIRRLGITLSRLGAAKSMGTKQSDIYTCTSSDNCPKSNSRMRKDNHGKSEAHP